MSAIGKALNALKEQLSPEIRPEIKAKMERLEVLIERTRTQAEQDEAEARRRRWKG